MLALKFYSLAALCRQTQKIRSLKSKLNQFTSFFHSTAFSFGQLEIKMPSLSPTMTEGTIVKWLKKEGDPISPGDVLCEIQTDKAVVGFEIEEEGTLLKIIKHEDSQNVKLGEVIALIACEGDDVVTASVKRTDITQEEKISANLKLHEDSFKLIGPAVRKLLKEYNIEFSAVRPSGPHNVILKGDVLSFINKKDLKPSTSAEVMPKTVSEQTDKIKGIAPKVSSASYVDLPLSSMRKTIARRLTESKTTIPHAYIYTDCIVDSLLNLRKKLKDDGINVSVNDFIIKCIAKSLSKHPKMNVINSNGNALVLPTIDISVAVATENGLITPIVKNANNLSIHEISDTVKSLAAKARQGKLHPEEFQGGSFTVSNLGMFGISEFSAVINPPQGAILAVGSTRFVSDIDHPVQKISVTLSFDCSIIGEEVAAEFMETLKAFLENPLALSL